MQSTANEHSVIVLKNNYMHINVDLPPRASAARHFNGSKSHFNVEERQRSKYLFFSFWNSAQSATFSERSPFSAAAPHVWSGNSRSQARPSSLIHHLGELHGVMSYCFSGYLQVSLGSGDGCCLHLLPRRIWKEDETEWRSLRWYVQFHSSNSGLV